jgi:hypothetical protein
VPVDRACRRPRDQVPAVGDRLERDAQAIRIAGRPDVPLIVPLSGRVEDFDVAAFGIGRLAELDAHLCRRLDQARVGGRIRSHVIRVRLRGAAHEDGTAEDARDEDSE